MGQYVDNMDNLVEGLLEVIPISYLLSPTFEEDIQKSIYRNNWINCISIPASISKLFGGEEAAAEAKLRNLCNSQNKSVPSLYKFVSFLISAYCSHNNKKVNLKEIKEALKSFGMAKFDKINQWDSSDYHINMVDNKTVMTITPKPISKQNAIMERNKKVFIVHGHNKALRTEVKSLLLELKLEPIILSEQANKGKTIIEKFEEQSNTANYAIILLTADDKGKSKDCKKRYKLRARQNVIFEMGYFMARLKNNLFLLIEDKNMELPSDISGIAYSYVKDDWKHKLAKELRECGYDVSSDNISVE